MSWLLAFEMIINHADALGDVYKTCINLLFDVQMTCQLVRHLILLHFMLIMT